ncbi:MAG: histidine phosphotransferase family protein [Alphaproteobacteria bacterium]|nr:histidine phosphotransferase family protein [Alphaproteobacteria bacterium]
MNKDFVLLQLLSSKICHDLVNPVAALRFSMDMIKDNEEENVEAFDIASSSVNALVSRLEYFRYAFGATNLPSHDAGFLKIRELIAALFKEKDVKVDWSSVDEDLLNVLKSDNLKLVLNIFFIIFNAVHKTAQIKFLVAKIKNNEIGVALSIRGANVKLGIDNIQALKLEVSPEDLTPRNVQSYFTALQAKNLEAQLEVRDNMQEEIQFALVLR